MQLLEQGGQAKDVGHLGWHRILKFAGDLAIAAIVLLTLSPSVWAQRRPVADGTLGNERSVVTPDTFNGRQGDRIDGGATRGENLFHSFQDFGVDEGRSVYFSNPVGIRNILSRVTGSNVSEILGVLGVLGDANLFLLNPNGIIFGPNAQLDVRGSFLASTGDRFSFADGSEFSAINPQAAPLLNVNISPGLQHGTGRGDLSNAANLAVGAGQRLTLYGGTVTSTGILTAPGGRVEILGDRVALLDNAQINVSGEMGEGTVLIGGDYRGQGTVPNALRTYVAPGVMINADALSNGNGGRVIVWGEEATGFYGNISARGGNIAGNGGFVEVSGREFLDFQGNVDTSAPNGVFGTLILDPVNIDVVADGGNTADTTLLFGDLPENVQIEASSINAAQSNVILEASSAISFNAPINIVAANVGLTATADSSLVINSPITTNGGDVNLSGFGQGTGINVFSSISSRGGDINFNGNSTGDRGINIQGNIDSGGGNITFTGTSNNTIGIATFNAVNSMGGNITFNGTNREAGDFAIGIALINSVDSGGGEINFTGSGIESGISTFEEGAINSNGGNINILSNSITLNNALTLDEFRSPTFSPIESANGDIRLSSISGDGNITLTGNLTNLEGIDYNFSRGTINSNGGSIYISGNSVVIDNVFLTSGPYNQDGNSGAITIAANNFSLWDSNIRGAVVGRGNVEPINVDASSIEFRNGSISGIVGDGMNGRVAPITISGHSITLLDSSRIASGDINGRGGAGLITLEAGSILLSNSGIGSTGNGIGNNANSRIIITATNGSVTLDNGGISTDGRGGPGGTINITANSVLLGNNSRIDTRGLGAGGGAVTIAANTVLIDDSGVRTGDSRRGGGPMIIQARDTLQITNNSLLNSQTFGGGDSGAINLAADAITVADSTIQSRTLDRGNAGQIDITANSAFSITNSQILSTVDTGQIGVAIGNGGKINVSTNSFSATNNSSILSSVRLGQGNAGDITVVASGTALLSGRSRIGSDVQQQGIGNGGNIAIQAGSLILFDQAEVNSSTRGQGEAGDISIAANHLEVTSGGQLSVLTESNFEDADAGRLELNIGESMTLSDSNSGLFAQTQGEGNAGSVFINVPQLEIQNGASISAFTTNRGNGGNITITAPRSVSLNRNSSISVETSGAGRAGDVLITADTLSVDQAARITATSTATATTTEGGGSITLNASNLDLAGTVGIFAETQGAVPAGTLTLQPDNDRPNLNIDLSGGAQISASTASSGRGGNLILTAPEAITIQGNGRLSVETTGTGRAGDISITAPRLTISDGAEVSASTSTAGGGGSLSVTAPTSVLLSNQGQLLTESTGSGRAGDLTINTPQLTLEGGSRISASNQSSVGGDIQLRELNLLSLDNSSITASTQAGEGGSLQISMREGGDIFLHSNSRLAAEATGGGNAGSLAINDVDELTLQGRSSTTVSSTEQGRAGGLAINAQTVSLNDGSAITGTTEAGRGNNIDLSIAESLRLNNNSQISASTQSGQGGNITIDGLDFLQVLSSLISAESTTGQAGQLSVNASNSVLLYGTGDQNRGGLSVQSRGGSAGDLNITTSELNIRNGASIAVSNSGQGNAGRLTVTARDVSLNQGSITGRTEAGEGGSIILRIADSLQLRNNSQISASTRDGQGGDITLRGLDSLQVFNSLILAESRSGRAGELNVNASDFVLLDGRGDGNRGGLSVRSRGGRAGDLSVTTNELDIRDGASIAVSNTGQEDAGALTITARDVSLNRGRITGTTVAGVGGNIQLDELNSLLLNDGSEISASTETGQGGNLRINTREGGDIVLDESRLAAEATSGGRAGNLVIRNADYLTVEEGSSITVSSAEGAAGNLRIVAGSVSLDNGTLEAVAGAGNDANITLNVSGTLFQLSNGSRVSAQALNDASGGNVELNVSNGFVVANPLGDNDIVANASQGNGGRVNIDALQIFGLEERTEDTPLSDINVSSTFGSSGTTEINTLNVNPAQGVVALPENVAPPTQVDQRCATGSGGTAGDRGAFVVSGRGGLPPNADEALGSDAVQVNLVTAEAADSAFTPTVSLPETDVGDGAIVEAQGWVVDANGNVVLTAAASTVTPNQSQYGTIECPIQ